MKSIWETVDNTNIHFRMGFVKRYKAIMEDYLNKQRLTIMPHICFFFDYKSDYNPKLIEWLKSQDMMVQLFSFENQASVKIMSGMRYLFISNISRYYLGKTRSEEFIIYQFRTLLNELNNSDTQIYFFLPDLIFQPNNEITYINKSAANSELDSPLAKFYTFLSHMICYHQGNYKVNRMVLPYLYQHELKVTDTEILDNNLFKITRFNTHFTKERKDVCPTNRSVLSYDEFAGILLKLYENSIEDRNYLISSPVYFSEVFLQGLYSTGFERKRKQSEEETIKLSLEDVSFEDGFDFFSTQKVFNMVKKLKYESEQIEKLSK
jgi:hypothetical protein